MIEPAFLHDRGGPYKNEWSGISVRDYFAAAAMCGLLAQSNGSALGSDPEIAAKYAYRMADAMLAETRGGKMNCKPGDLAVVVRGINTGRFVEVLCPLGVEPVFDGRRWCNGLSRGAFSWLVSSQGGPLRTLRGRLMLEVPMPDFCMRPIRDNDGEDEILRIAGKPEVIHA